MGSLRPPRWLYLIMPDTLTAAAAEDLPAPLLWKIAETDEDAARELAGQLNLPPLVGKLLMRRGVSTLDQARAFLEPRLEDLHDPLLLPDAEAAVDRLAFALEKGEKIFVHGDYDADGVTSAALCLRALAALGADVVGFVPRRSDGYDLQVAGVERAKEAGAKLILTADCGVCAVEPVAHARKLGLDVIVTDHHRPDETLPEAVAVVDPYREGSRAPFQALCGAGVAFKVLDALTARLMPQHRTAFRHNFVDLVAVGTVADVTPLVGENRILVTHGLRALAQGKKTGLKALLVSMDLWNRTLDAESISWKLGPRLNAAGRMEDADIAYRLLTTRDAAEAERLAFQLGELAERSRDETARVTTEALVEALLPENLDRRVLVLARERWGKGVIGIAAARVAEQRRRPAILLAYDADHDLYHGSARSDGQFKLLDALHGCHDLLERYGGHSLSAGVTLRAENLNAFRDRMHELALGAVAVDGEPPSLEIDAELTARDALTFPLVEAMERLAPFGRENEEPVLAARGATVLECRRMGREGSTLGMTVRLPGATQGLRAVWFRNGDWADRLKMGDDVDVAFTPKISEWNGRVRLELMLKDIRKAE